MRHFARTGQEQGPVLHPGGSQPHDGQLIGIGRTNQPPDHGRMTHLWLRFAAGQGGGRSRKQITLYGQEISATPPVWPA